MRGYEALVPIVIILSAVLWIAVFLKNDAAILRCAVSNQCQTSESR